MNYNPESIEGKRPRKGEIWIHHTFPQTVDKVIVLARRTSSTLRLLRRREKLSECEDLASLVAWCSIDGKKGGIAYESEFVKDYIFLGTEKSLVPTK